MCLGIVHDSFMEKDNAMSSGSDASRSDSNTGRAPSRKRRRDERTERRSWSPFRARVACANCRLAHASCSSERPCARCRIQRLECVPAPIGKRGRRPAASSAYHSRAVPDDVQDSALLSFLTSSARFPSFGRDFLMPDFPPSRSDSQALDHITGGAGHLVSASDMYIASADFSQRITDVRQNHSQTFLTLDVDEVASQINLQSVGYVPEDNADSRTDDQ